MRIIYACIISCKGIVMYLPKFYITGIDYSSVIDLKDMGKSPSYCQQQSKQKKIVYIFLAIYFMYWNNSPENPSPPEKFTTHH